MVGRARDVIEARDVAVQALVDSKQSEEESGRFVGRCATLTFPKGGAEVIPLG